MAKAGIVLKDPNCGQRKESAKTFLTKGLCMNIKGVIKVFIGIFKRFFYIIFAISCALIMVGVGYFIDLLMIHIQIIHIVIASLFMLLFISVLCIYKRIMNETNTSSTIKNTYLFWFGGSVVFIGSYLASR